MTWRCRTFFRDGGVVATRVRRFYRARLLAVLAGISVTICVSAEWLEDVPHFVLVLDGAILARPNWCTQFISLQALSEMNGYL